MGVLTFNKGAEATGRTRVLPVSQRFQLETTHSIGRAEWVGGTIDVLIALKMAAISVLSRVYLYLIGRSRFNVTTSYKMNPETNFSRTRHNTAHWSPNTDLCSRQTSWIRWGNKWARNDWVPWPLAVTSWPRADSLNRRKQIWSV